MKDLILVESPTKAKTLNRFLKGKYEVMASMGHIRDLPKSKLGVDIVNNFEPQYIIPKDKGKMVKELKAKVKTSQNIILATDPDREGEAIAFHLHEVLKSTAKKDAEFTRIVFHEITQKAIEEAMTHSRKIDSDLVFAQTARRVLDRVVGYKLSPLLWKKVKRGLSAGRVQSVALRLIVEREKEIEKFDKKTFYRLFAILNKKGDKTPINFELTKINAKAIESSNSIVLYDGNYTYATTNLDKEDAQAILAHLEKDKLKITNIVQKDTKRSSYPPFTTSTLQQAAFRRFSYSGKRTMSIAQKLYEEGYITYHRTDSFNLSTEFVTSSREFIEEKFGKEFLSLDVKVFKTKSKNAQEAHEAIRPTNIRQDESDITQKLGPDFAKLYNLILRRAVATQMSDAIYASTKIEVESKNDDKVYLLEANGRVLKFAGFLKMYSVKDEEVQELPNVDLHEILEYGQGNVSEHITNAPPRYNEASLVSSLEKHGIGRPSTYAPIMSTLFDRFYVEKIESRLTPTKIGISVNDFLVENFGDIDDIGFTATMEARLDAIANGEEKWVPMLKEFYAPFDKDLKKAEGAEHVAVAVEFANKICPTDAGQLVIRHSKFGKFLACNNFPECTYKESYTEDTGILCPKDKGNVVLKKTRKGRTFFGCSNYPNCDFAVWKKEDILKPKEPTTPAN